MVLVPQSDCPIRSKKARFNFMIWLKKGRLSADCRRDTNTSFTPMALDVILDFTGGTAIVDPAMISSCPFVSAT